MRECIYCGRQLEKGEQCTCAHAEAHRRAKGTQAPPSQKEKKAQEKANRKSEKERVKQARRDEAKRRKENAKYTRKRSRTSDSFAGAFYDLKRFFVSFIKSPVETVMNPGEMSKAVIFLFVIIEGIIGGMCVYAITTGAGRGPIRLLGSMMGFAGEAGYNHIRGFLFSALSGAISGILIFFVYSGVFYLVNKFIFKLFTPYWEFVKRFAFVAIPMTLIGALGVILGFFSYITFITLLICGLVGVVLITYEILGSVWYQKSATKIIYTMMICIFLIITVLMALLEIA